MPCPSIPVTPEAHLNFFRQSLKNKNYELQNKIKTVRNRHVRVKYCEVAEVGLLY
jgi:hypothetical protein